MFLIDLWLQTSTVMFYKKGGNHTSFLIN